MSGSWETDLSSAAKKAADHRANAANMINTVKSYDYAVEELDIIITGETDTVWGEAADHATREKVLLTVGNTKGIANVDDEMTTKAPAPEAKMHTVVNGSQW